MFAFKSIDNIMLINEKLDFCDVKVPDFKKSLNKKELK